MSWVRRFRKGRDGDEVLDFAISGIFCEQSMGREIACVIWLFRSLVSRSFLNGFLSSLVSHTSPHTARKLAESTHLVHEECSRHRHQHKAWKRASLHASHPYPKFPNILSKSMVILTPKTSPPPTPSS